MLQYFKKNKFHILAMALCLFMLAFVSLTPFTYKTALADDYDWQSEYTVEEVSSLYTNNESESSVDEKNFSYLRAVKNCISFDDYDHLVLDTGEAYSVADVEAVEAVEKNIQAMNELADLGLGYINEDFEFVFDEESNSFYQLAKSRSLAFKLTWRKATLYCYDNDYATAISTLFLAVKLGTSLLTHSVTDMLTIYSNSFEVQNLLQNANYYIYSDICSNINDEIFWEVINFNVGVNAEAYYQIADIINKVLNSISKGCIFMTAFKIICDLILPSYLDCFITLYTTIHFGSGVKVSGCWWPSRRDTLGVSLEAI
ncbi:MAG: hypothetical protein IJX87_01850 [Clostridia bacterium]|nr:hypothetical protein [Clostridia bacterium]